MDDIRKPRRRSRPQRLPTPPHHPLDLLIRIAVPIVLLLVAGGIVWYVYVQLNPFRNHLAPHLAPPAATGLNPVPAPITKYVVIDVGEKKIDSVHHLLPAQLRAGWPEEVSTIVHIRWRHDLVGRYSRGGIATRIDADVTVIDLKTGRTVANRHFSGGAPPHSVVGRQGASHSGDRPMSEVIDYLTALPQTLSR